MYFPFKCHCTSGNLSKNVTVYTCLCGEKRNLSQPFEDIWPVLIVDGLWVVIKSVISMAEVCCCVLFPVKWRQGHCSCQVCCLSFIKYCVRDLDKLYVYKTFWFYQTNWLRLSYHCERFKKLSKPFTVVIQPLSPPLIKPKIFVFIRLSHRRSTTVSLETRNP